MPLAARNRLSPCEDLPSVGIGGMGVVYRANDTKLGRDLALKMPPSETARDPERLAPFRREPKAFTQLHPNIVTILSVAASDGIYFMAMQLGRQKTYAIKAFDESLVKLGWKHQGALARGKKASAFATGTKNA